MIYINRPYYFHSEDRIDLGWWQLSVWTLPLHKLIHRLQVSFSKSFIWSSQEPNVRYQLCWNVLIQMYVLATINQTKQ